MLIRLLALAGAAAFLASCSSATPKPITRSAEAVSPVKPVQPVAPEALPAAPKWQPGGAEVFPNAKRIAARLAEAVTTYEPGSTPEGVAATAKQDLGFSQPDLATTIAPLVKPDAASVGEVIYPQMSGAGQAAAGVMVLVRQRSQVTGQTARSVSRVLDVRLERAGQGSWKVARLADVGGAPPEAYGAVGPEAKRALDHPNLWLPDSARWDIAEGGVDPALLAALGDAADASPLSVLVLRTGHPLNVWGTDRTSAHSVGKAADIYAVSGTLVIDQRRSTSSSAFKAASWFAQRGAAQLGSPWTFGANTFSDPVHADHLHVQWSSAR